MACILRKIHSYARLASQKHWLSCNRKRRQSLEQACPQDLSNRICSGVLAAGQLAKHCAGKGAVSSGKCVAPGHSRPSSRASCKQSVSRNTQRSPGKPVLVDLRYIMACCSDGQLLAAVHALKPSLHAHSCVTHSLHAFLSVDQVLCSKQCMCTCECCW